MFHVEQWTTIYFNIYNEIWTLVSYYLTTYMVAYNLNSWVVKDYENQYDYTPY